MSLFDTTSWTRLRTLDGSYEMPFHLSFSRDARLLVGGGRHKNISLWDVSNGQLLDQVDAVKNAGYVAGVAFSPDGRFLVTTAAWPYSIKIWDVAGRVFASAGELPHPQTIIRSLAFSPDGRHLVAGTEQGAHLFDWENRSGPELLRSTGDEILSVNFTSGARPRLLMGSGKGDLEVWDPTRSQRLAVFSEATGPIWDVSVCPNGKVLLASGAGDVIVLPSQSATRSSGEVISRNLMACEAISRAWQVLGVDALSTSKVIEQLEGNTGIDVAITNLAVSYVQSGVWPSINSRLRSISEIGGSKSHTDGEYRNALTLVLMVLEYEPHHPTALREAALLQFRVGDLASALETIQHATEAYQSWKLPGSARLQAIRSLILAALERVAEARRELDAMDGLDELDIGGLRQEAEKACFERWTR